MKIFFLSFQGGLFVGLGKLFISIVALDGNIFFNVFHGLQRQLVIVLIYDISSCCKYSSPASHYIYFLQRYNLILEARQIFLFQKRKREDFPQRRGSNLEGQTCILPTMKERIKNMIEEEQNQQSRIIQRTSLQHPEGT